MSVLPSFSDLNLDENETKTASYSYINVFKNPSEMPINQIHLEMNSFQLTRELPDLSELLDMSAKEVSQKFYKKNSEVIPALDKRWLPKCVIFKFEPYSFHLSKEENAAFLTDNVPFLESLEYLLRCNFHQFWCTILFEPSAIIGLRSFILNPIPNYEAKYLEEDFAALYKKIFNAFVLVYERLITFNASGTEYMTEEYGFKVLIDKKLLNLPIVNTLCWLYKSSHTNFTNKISNLYFNDTSELEFRLKEIEETINQSLIILEMIGGYVCGFSENAVIVPIAIPPRPKVFNLSWTYSIVTYLLNTIALLNTLLQFYKPAVEICLDKELPFRIPFAYVRIYRDIYESLYDRDEVKTQHELSDKVFDAINLGRSEFIDLFHVFVSYCLDKTLEYVDDAKQQEQIIEIYIKLLSNALEDEYFICDYDQKYNVAVQNEVFESCSSLDNIRTEFITTCISKLSRHKKLEELSRLNRHTIEQVFKNFKPSEPEVELKHSEVVPSTSTSEIPPEAEIDKMIRDIMDMFPHLGDGFILECLECYSYKSDDVINAILEENLAPHLYNISPDTVRIPPEPEPEKPVLAYRGKKPDYEDTLNLLNDKEDIKTIKNFVLEGVQYSNDYLYDDEYDDRDEDIPIKVADNQSGGEVLTFNPNHEEPSDETSSDEENEKSNTANGKIEGNKFNRNFCEDPAVLRAQREAKYKAKRPQQQQQQQPSSSKVVGKPKGQGQEKDVLKARHNKGVNKSSKANHNRKSGAQWKRSKGMFPV